MDELERKQFVEQAFQALYEHGGLKEMEPSSITGKDIAAFEGKYQIKLPALFKTYLMSYKLDKCYHPEPGSAIVGFMEEDNEIIPEIMTWYRFENISDMAEALESFREEAEEWELPEGSYENLIPFGYWDGWYCLDLNPFIKSADTRHDNNETEDCPVVCLDSDDDWDDYLDQNDVLHGNPVAPSFQTMLEWYFFGSLREAFEKRNQIILTEELLHNQEFLESWTDEKWKNAKS